MKKQDGFSLLELIIAIVILGILVAYVAVRYLSVDREARIAVVKNLEGTIKSQAKMAHALAMMRGERSDMSNKYLEVEGVQVFMLHGYPRAGEDGIAKLFSSIDGFTVRQIYSDQYNYLTVSFDYDLAKDPRECSVRYYYDSYHEELMVHSKYGGC